METPQGCHICIIINCMEKYVQSAVYFYKCFYIFEGGICPCYLTCLSPINLHISRPPIVGRQATVVQTSLSPCTGLCNLTNRQ